MKAVTSILAVIVLFLSTQCMVMEYGSPVKCKKTTTASCTQKKACSKSKKTSSEKDCRTVCNPFMACSGCAYETAIKEMLPLPSFLYKSVKNVYPGTRFISSYISSAWKPPEVI